MLRDNRSLLLGVSAPVAANDLAAVDAFARDAGKPAGIVDTYASFASPGFDSALADGIRGRGALPMLTWLPCLDGTLGPAQPAFSLRRIAGGAYDGYILRFADGVAAWGNPLLLRFAPEMNGPWNPWSAGANGNRPADYVRAWRHVHDLFLEAGATNVAWVWSPNVVLPGTPSLRSLYPGDAYVDWVGIDGYNWGTSRPGTRWQSFDQVFGPTLRAVRALTSRPLMLTEVASSERGGDKAAWIRDLFGRLRANPDILALVWFDFDKETDWRVASSGAAAAMFARGAADARVRGAGALVQSLDAR